MSCLCIAGVFRQVCVIRAPYLGRRLLFMLVKRQMKNAKFTLKRKSFAKSNSQNVQKTKTEIGEAENYSMIQSKTKRGCRVRHSQNWHAVNKEKQ